MILTEAIPTRTVDSAVALSPAELLGVLAELARRACDGGARSWSTVPTSGGSPASPRTTTTTSGSSAGTRTRASTSTTTVARPVRSTSSTASCWRRRPGAQVRTPHEQRIRAGTARAFGPGHVHRVVNPSAAVATSLHVYSPPLVTMDFYGPMAGHAGARRTRARARGALGARRAAMIGRDPERRRPAAAARARLQRVSAVEAAAAMRARRAARRHPSRVAASRRG